MDTEIKRYGRANQGRRIHIAVYMDDDDGGDWRLLCRSTLRIVTFFDSIKTVRFRDKCKHCFGWGGK